MLKKLAYLFIFAIVFILVDGSCMDRGTCPHTEEYFDISGAEIYFYIINAGKSVRIPDSTVVREYNYGLAIKLNYTYVAENKRNQFSLISTAYADCACCGEWPGYKGSIEKIDSFYIVPEKYRIEDASGWMDTVYSMHQKETVHLPNGYTAPYIFIDGFDYNLNLNPNPKIVSSYFKIRIPEPFYYITSTAYQRLKLVLKFTNGERYEAYTQAIKFV